jgi:hypothetical protein
MATNMSDREQVQRGDIATQARFTRDFGMSERNIGVMIGYTIALMPSHSTYMQVQRIGEYMGRKRRRIEAREKKAKA